MTLDQLIDRARRAREAKEAERDAMPEWIELHKIRDKCALAKRDPDDREQGVLAAHLRALAPVMGEVTELRARENHLLEEKARDDVADKLSREITPGAPAPRTPETVHGPGVEASRATPEHPWIRSNDGQPAVVARGQRVAEHPVVRAIAGQQAEREQAVIGQHGSLGHLVRSMTTTSGSAIVPTVWATDIIDRARNFAAVLQAGAEIVPMDAKIVQVGRLTGDPTAAFRTEGSTVTASDPTFDNVTLTATTMSALVVGSLEWFQDANNVDEIVTNAIAKAMALQLDLAGLYGSITSGAGAINLPTPPNPRGVLGTLNALRPANVLGAATNGTVQTTGALWNELLDLIFTVRDANEKPNAVIWNSKAARQYAKSYDTLGQPLRTPDTISELETYVSNQVPSYTQGTMTNRATDVFAGDWSQLLIGQRLDMSIQTLTERYAENGQIGIIAHWRGDIQAARPAAFAVYKALQGA